MTTEIRQRRGSIGSPGDMHRAFFHLCGSPIRTAKVFENEPTSAMAVDEVRTPEMPFRGFQNAMAAADIDAGDDQDLIGYYGYPSFSYDEPDQELLDEEETAPLPLNSAKQAGIPLYLSDWFQPNGKHPARDESVGNSLLPHQTINIGELVLGKIIGEGAFGKVYKAHWHNRPVAVKVLIRSNLSDDVVREFESEVKIMSFLHHPNICQLLGACLEPSNRALVIELVEQGSLWNVLRSRKHQLNDAIRAKFVLDTARGMGYLHQFNRPILHRDMKSPNLLVENDFSIKITDFGLARVKAQIQTMTGNCGTVQWMAPEVLGNQKYTEKADVFSFGIVIWEIFTAKCPYEGMTQIQAALGVLNHDLRPTIPRNCPRFFARLMRSCWLREPSLRPSFAELVRAFEQYNDPTLVQNQY